MSEMKKREEYLMRQNEARGLGMDAVLSVRLCVPKDMEHILVPGDNGESIALVFYSSAVPMAVIMEHIAKQHDPMIVKWVMPIGKIPKLLPPLN